MSVIAISSADVGDGKTTTAVNLAGALAQSSERRVLLVDADLRRPAVAARLGLDAGRRGLAEAVFDASLDLTAVSQRYAPFNLSVVTAGRFSGITYEALQSSRFGQLLAEARHHYDHVILDTPPMVPITDVRIMGPYVDRFILVVGAHRTPRKLLGEALSVLPPDKVLGLIFNYDGRTSERHRAYYGLEPQPRPRGRGWARMVTRLVTVVAPGLGTWR
jgi:capsular exopolysaccharide synthesis family protein